MARAKAKEQSHIHDAKWADKEAATAAQIHFAVAAVCGFMEKSFSELHKNAA